MRRMEERERGRAEARAKATAMFEEQRRMHDEAVENEGVRIARLEVERSEMMKQEINRHENFTKARA